MAKNKAKQKHRFTRRTRTFMIIGMLLFGGLVAFAAVSAGTRFVEQGNKRVNSIAHPVLSWQAQHGAPAARESAQKRLNADDHNVGGAITADKNRTKSYTQSDWNRYAKDYQSGLRATAAKDKKDGKSLTKKQAESVSNKMAAKDLGGTAAAKSLSKKTAAAQSGVASAASDSDGDEPSSFKDKVAQALLNIFWSSNIGKWVEENGPAGTVFGYTNGFTVQDDSDSSSSDSSQQQAQSNQKNAQAGAQGDPNFNPQAIVSDLNNKVNQDPLALIFPDTAYSKDMDKIIDQFQPIMIAVAAVIIVISVIISGARLGWGQALDESRSRVMWYHNMIDTAIAIVGILCFAPLVKALLQVDGTILLTFEQWMANHQINSTGGTETLLQSVFQLGADDSTLKMIAGGNYLGSGFSGIFWNIVYLCTLIGVAVWIKYYYFVRMIAFDILMILGPIFLAFWPYGWGKERTFAWLKDTIGTIFIQAIHAFVLTFMGLMMVINNQSFLAIKNATDHAGSNQAAGGMSEIGQALANIFTGGHFHGASIAGGLGKIATAPATQAAAQSQQFIAHWEAMVVGFIILILFQPVSKSIAELFGISTNMLDQIHQSSSRTLMTGAAIGATAGAGLALGAGNLALGGLSAAAKGARNLKRSADANGGLSNAAKLAGDNAWNRAKNGGRRLRDNALNRLKHPVKTAKGIGNKLADQDTGRLLARANGFMGPNAGRLAGLAAGAGAGSPIAMIGLSRAGGEVGQRAAALTTRKLASLGLKEADPYRGQRAASQNLASQANQSIRAGAGNAIDKEDQLTPDREQAILNQLKAHGASPAEIQHAKQQMEMSQAAMNQLTPQQQAQAAAMRKNALAQQMRNGDYHTAGKVQEALQGANQAFTSPAAFDRAQKAINADYDPNSDKAIAAKAKAVGMDINNFKQQYAVRHPQGNLDATTYHQQMNAAANAAMQKFHDNVVSAGEVSAEVAGADGSDPILNHNTESMVNAVNAAKGNWQRQATGIFNQRQQAALAKGKLPGNWRNFANYQGSSAYQNDLQKFLNSPDQAKAWQKFKAHDPGITKAAANLNGDVLAHQSQAHNDAFNNSVIDRNAYKQQLGQRLNDLSASDQYKQAIMNAVDDLDGGQSMNLPLSQKAGAAPGTYSLNEGLYKQVMAQRADRLNSAQAGNPDYSPVTVDDLAHVYANTPNVSPAAFANHVGDVARQNELNYNQGMQKAYKLGQVSDQAADELSGFNGQHGSLSHAYNSFMGPGTGLSSSGLNSVGQGPDLSKNPFANEVEYNSPDLGEIRQMVPTVTNDRGEFAGVKPGALRMVVENGRSYMQAMNHDGNYVTFGHYGVGDGSLGAGQKVYQDYNFTPSGDLVHWTDPSTHLPTGLYRMSNGQRVPVALPNGAPDVSSMVSGVANSDGYGASFNTAPDMYSPFHGMRNAPELSRALANDADVSDYPCTDNYQGYQDKQLMGDANSMIITGLDPLTNTRRALTVPFENRFWPELRNGVTFTYNLDNSAGALHVTPHGGQLDFGNVNLSPSEQSVLSEDLENHFSGINGTRADDYINSEMIKPTKAVLRNDIRNNPASSALTSMDTFQK